mmetsp:Transcript_49200/g.154574  ORF Transcript_49200/g.154574 Transcript_49200/m.154574 type:complete len:238 (-) Transcript_49200:343-1056(-)
MTRQSDHDLQLGVHLVGVLLHRGHDPHPPPAVHEPALPGELRRPDGGPPACLGIALDANVGTLLVPRDLRQAGEAHDLPGLLEAVHCARVGQQLVGPAELAKLGGEVARHELPVPLRVVEPGERAVGRPVDLPLVEVRRARPGRRATELEDGPEVRHVDVVHEGRRPHPVAVEVTLLSLEGRGENLLVAPRRAGVGTQVVLHAAEGQAPLNTVRGVQRTGRVGEEVPQRDLNLHRPR